MSAIRVALPEWPGMTIYCDSPQEAVAFVTLVADSRERDLANAKRARKRERERQYWQNAQRISCQRVKQLDGGIRYSARREGLIPMVKPKGQP